MPSLTANAVGLFLPRLPEDGYYCPSHPLRNRIMRHCLRDNRYWIPTLAGMLTACGGKSAPPVAPEPEVLPAVAPAPAVPLAPANVVVRVDTVVTRDPAQDQRIALLELQVIEREAELEQLQTRLEDAHREVVRAMAKLRTSASKAEAASAMAEAEVAVGALSGSGAGRGAPEVTEARRLLAMSTAEFNRTNYGGAVYLANQSKLIAAAGRSRIAEAGRVTPRQGEVLFAVPLRLRAVGRTNVREGPGTDQAVLFTVESGAAVTAHSVVGDWVRMSDGTGRTGWIIRSRLGRREESGR